VELGRQAGDSREVRKQEVKRSEYDMIGYTEELSVAHATRNKNITRNMGQSPT